MDASLAESAQVAQVSLPNLPNHILFHCLEALDDVQDVLRCSRVNKRFYCLVGNDALWQSLFETDFASGVGRGHTVPTGAVPSSWRGRYKDRFCANRRERLQLSAARRVKARSAVHTLESEVWQLQRALQQEAHRLTTLQHELARLRQARQDALIKGISQMYWQPVAVTRAHGAVVNQAPVNVRLVMYG